MSHALEVLGVIAAALLAGGAIVATSVRARAALVLAALALAPLLLVVDVWNSPQVHTLRDRPAVFAVAALVAAVAVAALAWLMAARPAVLPLLAVAALPFRIPISAGGSTASLLLPLYLVVAAGVLAYAVPRLRGEDDDALGFVPRKLARGPATLTVADDKIDLFRGDVFGGTGVFSGLSAFEPIVPPPGARVLAQATTAKGTTAIVAARIGRGLAVRIGVPDLPSRLSQPGNETALVKRVWQLLRAR